MTGPMMDLELPVTLVGGTWVVTNLILSLRKRIADRWDVIFGVKEAPGVGLEVKEYLLRKEIVEDMTIITIILATVALVFCGLGYGATGFNRTVFWVASGLYVIGAVTAALCGARDYRRWWIALHGGRLR